MLVAPEKNGKRHDIEGDSKKDRRNSERSTHPIGDKIIQKMLPEYCKGLLNIKSYG